MASRSVLLQRQMQFVAMRNPINRLLISRIPGARNRAVATLACGCGSGCGCMPGCCSCLPCCLPVLVIGLLLALLVFMVANQVPQQLRPYFCDDTTVYAQECEDGLVVDFNNSDMPTGAYEDYRWAQDQTGVPWFYLMAWEKVTTDFGQASLNEEKTPPGALIELQKQELEARISSMNDGRGPLNGDDHFLASSWRYELDFYLNRLTSDLRGGSYGLTLLTQEEWQLYGSWIDQESGQERRLDPYLRRDAALALAKMLRQRYADELYNLNPEHRVVNDAAMAMEPVSHEMDAYIRQRWSTTSSDPTSQAVLGDTLIMPAWPDDADNPRAGETITNSERLLVCTLMETISPELREQEACQAYEIGDNSLILTQPELDDQLHEPAEEGGRPLFDPNESFDQQVSDWGRMHIIMGALMNLESIWGFDQGAYFPLPIRDDQGRTTGATTNINLYAYGINSYAQAIAEAWASYHSSLYGIGLVDPSGAVRYEDIAAMRFWRPYFDEAAAKHNVRWEDLAAIFDVQTSFGRNVGPNWESKLRRWGLATTGTGPPRSSDSIGPGPGPDSGPGPGSSGPRLSCEDRWKDHNSPPPYIWVLRTSKGGGTSSTMMNRVEKVEFRRYVNTVISGEMPSYYPLEALKAQAIATKQYAWYKTMTRASYSVGGYSAVDGACFDVVDNHMSQVYKPERRSPTDKQVGAVSATWSVYTHRNGKIWMTSYRRGQSTDRCGGGATVRGWRLYQIAAKDCANRGQSWRQIINTYYYPIEIFSGQSATPSAYEQSPVAALANYSPNAPTRLTQPSDAPVAAGAQAVVSAARALLGKPYKLGAEGPYYYDCSGFLYRVFSDTGQLSLIGGRRSRARVYMKWFMDRGLTSKTEVKPGDLVVYDNGAHIGLYVGDGKVISALVNSGLTLHSLNGISTKFTMFLNVQYSGASAPGPVPVPPGELPPVDWTEGIINREELIDQMMYPYKSGPNAAEMLRQATLLADAMIRSNGQVNCLSGWDTFLGVDEQGLKRVVIECMNPIWGIDDDGSIGPAGFRLQQWVGDRLGYDENGVLRSPFDPAFITDIMARQIREKAREPETGSEPLDAATVPSVYGALPGWQPNLTCGSSQARSPISVVDEKGVHLGTYPWCTPLAQVYRMAVAYRTATLWQQNQISPGEDGNVNIGGSGPVGYEPRFVTQLDGTPWASTNCNMASAAMLLDKQSYGRYRFSGHEMRIFSGNRNPPNGSGSGTTLKDSQTAFRNCCTPDEPINSFPRMPYETFKSRIRAGHGAVVWGKYWLLDDRWSIQDSRKDFLHALYVTRYDPNTDMFLIFDPVGRTAQKGTIWWPSSIMRLYGGSLAGGPNFIWNYMSTNP